MEVFMFVIRVLLVMVLSVAFVYPQESFISAYFSKISGRYYVGGVDNRIIDDISSATTSIEMAMYYLTNRHITDALIDAHHRGINVKITTDDHKIHSSKYRKLSRAGIPITHDADPKALMHDKILIIDRHIVWIGSGNYTVYAFYRNYDNFLRIDDPKIALYYHDKFEKLYHNDSKPIKPYLSKDIEIYFAPDINIEKRLLARIHHAKKTIYFLAYAFTNQHLAQALVEAHQRGVTIKGVFDRAQDRYQKYSRYRWLKTHGIDVVYDHNRYKLHDKVIIIDGKVVVTGSYNFTHKANTVNAENIIVIKNKQIANSYTQEFFRIYLH